MWSASETARRVRRLSRSGGVGPAAWVGLSLTRGRGLPPAGELGRIGGNEAQIDKQKGGSVASDAPRAAATRFRYFFYDNEDSVLQSSMRRTFITASQILRPGL